MDREIKFRVWCSKTRMMYAYAEVGVNGLKFWELIDISQYDVMQFTGLKDKNGVEIYEGDIYEELVEKGWIDKSLNRMVYKKYPVKMVVKMQINYCEEYGDIYGYPMYLEKREIIGNIYENPELLKEVNKKVNIEEELLIGTELSRMRCEVCDSIDDCTCFCKCGLSHDCCVCEWKEEDFKNV